MTLSTSLVAVCYSSDFLKLARARLHLVEQPHVLDRDHRLVGEGGEQLDLLVGERPASRYAAETIAPIGTPSRSSGTPNKVLKSRELLRLCLRVFRVGKDVGEYGPSGLPGRFVQRPTHARVKVSG